MRNFDEWLKTFTDNINNWNYYVNLKETYDVQDDIYNINVLKNGIIKERFVYRWKALVIPA